MITESSALIQGKKVAFKTWNSPDLPPILALHGWLDNCASFDFLAPKLKHYHIIAPDLAGHGLSDHRSLDSAYNIWQDIDGLNQLLEYLVKNKHYQWQTINLLGHSRGAYISVIMAAALPEKINRLVLLDGILPDPMYPKDAPKQLAAAIHGKQQAITRQPKAYTSQEEAIKTKYNSPLQLSTRSATAFANRELEQTNNGFTWRTDPRLKAALEFKLSEQHGLAFIESIHCPVLQLRSKQPVFEPYQQALDNKSNVITKSFEASHHLHMDESLNAVALEINTFLSILN